jgi:hypothetical protein
MRLFGELVGQHVGPIIVVGGGPSAPAALDMLWQAGVEPVAVLSANEHGHKQSTYAITHSVCADATHGESRQSMESVLRRYGVPIITPHYFGDVRLCEWSLAANTGLQAIAVAVFMGGAPVIPVGIDCYGMTSRDVYFHAPNAKSNSSTKNESNFHRQLGALKTWIGSSAPVRPVGGPASSYWPAWTPTAAAASLVPPRGAYYRSLAKLILQARPHGRVSFKSSTLEPRRIFPASPTEARGLILSNDAKLIESHPPPDGSPLVLPKELTREPKGYRPSSAIKGVAISRR